MRPAYLDGRRAGSVVAAAEQTLDEFTIPKSLAHPGIRLKCLTLQRRV